MIINAQNLSRLFTGYKTTFQNAFSGVPVLWPKVAMLVPSTTSEEEYDWLGDISDIREWIGERVVNNLKSHGYKIKNKKFEHTVGVPRDRIDDDQYGIYAPRFALMGDNAARFPDKQVFGLLGAGTAMACFDGQYFFDTDHPVLVNGVETSVSNYGGGTGDAWYLLDTSRPIKPIIYQERKKFNFVSLVNETDPNVFFKDQYIYGVDGRANVGFGFWQMAYCSKQPLTADSYALARAAMASLKNEAGTPLGILPNLLVVPPSLEGTGRKLLKNEYAANGATNEWFGTADVLNVPYLA